MAGFSDFLKQMEGDQPKTDRQKKLIDLMDQYSSAMEPGGIGGLTKLGTIRQVLSPMKQGKKLGRQQVGDILKTVVITPQSTLDQLRKVVHFGEQPFYTSKGLITLSENTSKIWRNFLHELSHLEQDILHPDMMRNYSRAASPMEALTEWGAREKSRLAKTAQQFSFWEKPWFQETGGEYQKFRQALEPIKVFSMDQLYKEMKAGLDRIYERFVTFPVKR
jgi:hypothetical protein